MAQFKYKVLNNTGFAQEVIGELPASSLWEAHEYLESKGHMVISVDPLPFYLIPYFSLRKSLDRRKVKRADIAEFLRNIALMLGAGITLLEALSEAADHSDNVYMASVAADMKNAVSSGLPFSEAINQHKDLFPQSVCYLTEVGEKVGRLDQTLMDASKHLTKIDRIVVGVKKAMTYPAFVFVFALGACIFWLNYTIPTMIDLFKQMQVELPAVTRWLLDFSSELIDKGLIYTVAIVLVIVAFRLSYTNIASVKIATYRLLMKIPAVKGLIESSNMSFIFEYFALMSNAGVDVHTSLGIISDALENPIYAGVMKDIKRSVETGQRLTDGFSSSEMFPPMVIRMLSIGENSGKLGEQMAFIAEEYAIKLADAVDKFKSFIEPLAVGFVGAFMIFMIIALFLPVYDLIGGVT